MGPKLVQLRVRVDLGVMGMKRYATLPRCLVLEPHHQVPFSVIHPSVEGYSQHILSLWQGSQVWWEFLTITDKFYLHHPTLVIYEVHKNYNWSMKIKETVHFKRARFKNINKLTKIYFKVIWKKNFFFKFLTKK